MGLKKVCKMLARSGQCLHGSPDTCPEDLDIMCSRDVCEWECAADGDKYVRKCWKIALTRIIPGKGNG